MKIVTVVLLLLLLECLQRSAFFGSESRTCEKKWYCVENETLWGLEEGTMEREGGRQRGRYGGRGEWLLLWTIKNALRVFIRFHIGNPIMWQANRILSKTIWRVGCHSPLMLIHLCTIPVFYSALSLLFDIGGKIIRRALKQQQQSQMMMMKKKGARCTVIMKERKKRRRCKNSCDFGGDLFLSAWIEKKGAPLSFSFSPLSFLLCYQAT